MWLYLYIFSHLNVVLYYIVFNSHQMFWICFEYLHELWVLFSPMCSIVCMNKMMKRIIVCELFYDHWNNNKCLIEESFQAISASQDNNNDKWPNHMKLENWWTKNQTKTLLKYIIIGHCRIFIIWALKHSYETSFELQNK